MEEDHEEDASSVDLDDVHAVLSIGDVPLTKEYSLEHPVDVRSLCLLVPLFLTGFRIGYVILPAALLMSLRQLIKDEQNRIQLSERMRLAMCF